MKIQFKSQHHILSRNDKLFIKIYVKIGTLSQNDEVRVKYKYLVKQRMAWQIEILNKIDKIDVKLKIQTKSANWRSNKNFELKQRIMYQIEYHNHSIHLTDTVSMTVNYSAHLQNKTWVPLHLFI